MTTVRVKIQSGPLLELIALAKKARVLAASEFLRDIREQIHEASAGQADAELVVSIAVEPDKP